MTSPSALEHLAALGLPPGAGEDEVLKAHKAKVRPLQKRASNAPPEMRDQAERDQAALESATQALLAELRLAAPQARPVSGGHYAVLGVAPTAGAAEIEAAHAARARVLQHHASVGTSPEVRQQAKGELTALAQARQVLLDPDTRAAHDRDLAAPGRTVAPDPVQPESTQPQSAQPRPAQPQPTQPRSAQPRSASPQPGTAQAPSPAPLVSPVPPRDLGDDDRLRLGGQRFGAGDFPAVVQLLDPLVRRTSPHTGAARLLGLSAARLGQAELALEALTLARPEHVGDPETAATLVELLSALSRQAEAVSFAEQAAREDPTERLAVTRAVLTALSSWRQPDVAARLGEQLLGPRLAEPAAVECLVDVLLAACDGHRTQLADGRLVLATATQCARVHELVQRIVALGPTSSEAHSRLRRLRVQLMDARTSAQWTSGERWQPRTAAPPALVTRWGTP